MFSANDVKELREKTGAGMLDCRNALKESDGNMEKAIDWLREKGISKAAKKASRIAAEGISLAVSDDNDLTIVEVNCETDFVAKNDEFKDLASDIAKSLVHTNITSIEEANSVVLNSHNITINEAIVAFTAKIGEKISFRRFERITKNADEYFGIYSHMGGKITTIVVIKGANEEVAKDVAMHVAAMRPTYLTSSYVPAEVIEHEKGIIKEQAINEGKPADIAEKMVMGRIQKFYKEVCLVDQEFIKDNTLSVGQYVKNNSGEIEKMIRYEVGEGMEKRNDDFASEVMSQINK